MKLVFICAPYRGATLNDVGNNIRAAQSHGIDVINQLGKYGYFPVIPHNNTAFFDFDTCVDTEFRTNDKYWISGTSQMMLKCDIVYCPYLVGEVTEGMRQELEIANDHNIPVYNHLKTITDRLEREAR
jgi:hypothetical protein